MATYSAETIADLYREAGELLLEQVAIQKLFLAYKFITEDAREQALSGYLRRTNTLLRAIENVFELLPPELDAIPDRNVVVDATISIHAFVVNTFGALDNLAWILVNERNVVGKKGKNLNPKSVSLANPYLLASCGVDFRAYLERRDDWNKGMRAFRDSLAHQVPLYIPPYTIKHADREQYDKFENEKAEALISRKPGEYKRLDYEQSKLGTFHPVMVRSVSDEKGQAQFHPQLISDFRTVHEFGREVLNELGRNTLPPQ